MKKTMLITGSSSGIGYECADKFKDQYEIIGVSKTPGLYVTEVGNLKDDEFRKFLVDKYQPDVFINNAGIGGSSNYSSVLDTNATAAIDLLLSFHSKMKSGSDIINISSYSGWKQGNGIGHGHIAYSATKHALSFASQSLAFKKHTQIRVMTLEPENVVSKIHGQHPFSKLPFQYEYDQFNGIQQLPMPTRYIADTIEWMLMQPRWVNIQTIRITNNYIQK
jgi:NADP-dependent 3-hydroxy acid dehydrogenase YdfG